MPWDPERYEQFKAERYQPFEDLIGLINVRDGMSVIDLGCGTGELTSRLADALPGSDVLGVDSSSEMLAVARKLERDGLRFERCEIEDVTGGWDVIFSNAAIHWVEGHDSLIGRLFSLLRPDGQIAVQIPSNFGHDTHTIINEVAASEPFREGLDGFAWNPHVLTFDAYAALLYAHGGTDITCFEKVYPHVLPDADALADWMSGTALVPYMERLPEALREPFMERYRERLRGRFPTKPVFFGFRRILFAATRAAELEAGG
ncbi:MAG: methyltransferase domain-containing protein [Chloroflexi bacterium]|nr:methyltransferase domain-containing protein [Chloroflexota bacterium]